DPTEGPDADEVREARDVGPEGVGEERLEHVRLRPERFRPSPSAHPHFLFNDPRSGEKLEGNTARPCYCKQTLCGNRKEHRFLSSIADRCFFPVGVHPAAWCALAHQAVL